MGAVYFQIELLALWDASHKPSYCVSESEAAEQRIHKEPICLSLREKTLRDPVALFTFVLAVSTIGLWIVTYISARAAKDAAETLPILERAYVFGGMYSATQDPSDPHNPVFTNIGHPDAKVRFTITAINSGRTPTILKRLRVACCEESALPPEPAFGKGMTCELDDVLPAGETRNVREFEGAYSDTKLYYGDIEYEDLFLKRHHSNFIMRFRFKPGSTYGRTEAVTGHPAYQRWD